MRKQGYARSEKWNEISALVFKRPTYGLSDASAVR